MYTTYWKECWDCKHLQLRNKNWNHDGTYSVIVNTGSSLIQVMLTSKTVVNGQQLIFTDEVEFHVSGCYSQHNCHLGQ